MNTDKNIKSILITKFKHIGDVLMLTPAVAVLKKQFPDAKITLVVHKGTESVIIDNPHIDKIIVFDRSLKKKGLLKNICGQLKLVSDIRKTKPDLCIELTGGDRGAIISFVSGAGLRIGYAKRKKGMLFRDRLFTDVYTGDDEKIHAAQSNLNVLTQIGIGADVKDYPLELYVSDAARKEADELFAEHKISCDDFIVFVHPVSRWFFKCWDDKKVALVCDYLKQKYNAVVLLSGGPAEKEKNKINNIINLCKNKEKTIDLSGKMSLETLAAVLESSTVFLGVDTALMHMASALKKPMVVLFGPTGSHNWGPLNQEAVVLKKDELECMPCGKAGCDDSKKSRCLDMIEVSDVTDSFDKLIEVVI